MVISNHNSFRLPLDKIASVYFLWKKIYSYFSSGNGQPREPALCQLYRHTFVPYVPISSTQYAINRRPWSIESWQYLQRSTFYRRAWSVYRTERLSLCTARCRWGSASRAPSATAGSCSVLVRTSVSAPVNSQSSHFTLQIHRRWSAAYWHRLCHTQPVYARTRCEMWSVNIECLCSVFQKRPSFSFLVKLVKNQPILRIFSIIIIIIIMFVYWRLSNATNTELRHNIIAWL